MIPWSSHRILRREIEIHGYILAESPLRVGAGRDSPLGSTVDLAIIRIRLNGINVPYIPGSSIKGVFRSVAMSLALEKGLDACSGLSRQTCMDNKKVEGKTLLEFIQECLRKGENDKAIRKFHEKSCVLCKLFGAPSFTGHVNFSDAYPIDEEGNVLDVPVGVKTGIAIDRRTGAVYRGALYQVEFVQPGSKFKFSIRATNLPNYCIGLIAKVLRMLNDGWVRIGGFKTRGFGKIKFKSLSFRVRGEIDGYSLNPIDEFDERVDVDVAEISNGWLFVSEESVWDVFKLFEEVWDRANLKAQTKRS